LPLLEEAYNASRTLPVLRWVGVKLLEAYVSARRREEGTKLAEELVSNACKSLPPNSLQIAGLLARFSLSLLELEAFAEAEPLLREALTIRERDEPDAWTRFNTQSMLGSALLGQEKYSEAEPLLLAGYEGLKAREAQIPPQASPRIPEALDRLIALAEATDRPEEAEKWRAERGKYPEPASRQPVP
jgi:hypothetical protein